MEHHGAGLHIPCEAGDGHGGHQHEEGFLPFKADLPSTQTTKPAQVLDSMGLDRNKHFCSNQNIRTSEHRTNHTKKRISHETKTLSPPTADPGLHP